MAIRSWYYLSKIDFPKALKTTTKMFATQEI